MAETKKYNTLLIRMDKIGDLVVSLNANQHPTLKDQQCLWVISRGLGWVMQHSAYSKNFIEVDKSFSFKGLFQLVRKLRQSGANNAIVFQAPWFLSFALWLARIPVRVGRLSQWHSYLFFNRGVRQKRSLAEMHESAYNWQLISQGMSGDNTQYPLTHPHLTASETVTGIEIPSTKYCVVHPGMMGSALNWPTENYKLLVEKLAQKITVVITGTAADRPWTEPLKYALSSKKNIIWLQEKLNPQQLLVVLDRAAFVMAPSTGIIHLASALKTPVVGVYSPRQSEKANRWGPLNEQAIIFTPEVSEINVDAECMRQISVEQVYSAIEGGLLS